MKSAPVLVDFNENIAKVKGNECNFGKMERDH